MFAEETLLVILNDKLYANKCLSSDQKAFGRRAGDGAGPDSDKLEVLADPAPFPRSWEEMPCVSIYKLNLLNKFL